MGCLLARSSNRRARGEIRASSIACSAIQPINSISIGTVVSTAPDVNEASAGNEAIRGRVTALDSENTIMPTAFDAPPQDAKVGQRLASELHL